jgi:hypothetical protein
VQRQLAVLAGSAATQRGPSHSVAMQELQAALAPRFEELTDRVDQLMEGQRAGEAMQVMDCGVDWCGVCGWIDRVAPVRRLSRSRN